MQLRITILITLTILTYIFLTSSRMGTAASIGIDRTGSPLANGLNCGSCHSGAFNSALLELQLKDVNDQIVTSYTPGKSYTIEANVSSTSGFSRGFQLVALNSSNGQAGSFSNPGSDTQISPIGNISYLEHSNSVFSASNYVFYSSWTAPPSNSGSVTFYSAGVVGNGDNNTTRDDPISPITLTITESVILPALLSYFQGFREGSEVKLTWETIHEESFDNFTLEQSNDGQNFAEVASIKAKGSNSKYEQTDTNNSSNHTYYRLRLNDFNGAYEYSETVTIEGKKENEIAIFPNPTSGSTWINFASEQQDRKVTWFDIQGLELGSALSKGDRLELPLATLIKGLYIVMVTDLDGRLILSERIIKQ